MDTGKLRSEADVIDTIMGFGKHSWDIDPLNIRILLMVCFQSFQCEVLTAEHRYFTSENSHTLLV